MCRLMAGERSIVGAAQGTGGLVGVPSDVRVCIMGALRVTTARSPYFSAGTGFAQARGRRIFS